MSQGVLSPRKTQRNYQRSAARAWFALLKRKPGARALINLPTGTGKTSLAVSIASRSGRVLWLSPRDEIIRQTVQEALGAFRARDIGIVKASRNEVDRRLVIASVQTAKGDTRLAEVAASGAFDLIVVDECHHARAATWEAIAAAFPGVPMLGLTATTERGDRKALGAVFTDGIVYRMSTQEAVRKGWLVRPVTRRVVEPSLSRLLKDDYDERSAEKLRAGCARTVARVVEEAIEERRRVIAFVIRVDQAQRVTRLLKRRGRAVEWVAGAKHMPLQERREKLRAYEHGDLDALINVDLLTEGYDNPSTNCIVMAAPTLSRTQYLQKIGRGLRTHEASGKTDCLIVDVVGVSEEWGEYETSDDIFGPDAKTDEERFREEEEREREREARELAREETFARCAIGEDGRRICRGTFAGVACDRPAACKGLCRVHTSRQRQGTPMDAPLYVRGMLCQSTIEGSPCGRRAGFRGLCELHMRRQEHGLPMDGPVKLFSGERTACTAAFGKAPCGRPATLNSGLCRLHTARARRGIPLNAPKRGRNHGVVCHGMFAGVPCGRPARKCGLCSTHRSRQLKGLPMDMPIGGTNAGG